MADTIEATKPRPTTLTKEIRECAADQIVGQLIAARHLDETERDAAVKSIARHGTAPYIDGYALGRALEDYDGWDINFRMAEILDSYSCYLRDEMKAAEKRWAEETNQQPTFKKGTRVKLNSGETGTIDGIYEFGAAEYTVKIDGDPQAGPPNHSRRIVRFEDAEAI